MKTSDKMSTRSPAMDALIAVSTAANDGSDNDGTSDDHEEDKSTETGTGTSNEEKEEDDEATDEEEMDGCIDDSFRTAQSALTEYSSKDNATAHLNPNEHARVNDPILRPVKKHRKKENYPFGGGANTEASDVVDTGETHIVTTTNEQTPVQFSESILSRLFMPDRMQRRELWEFVRLVAPGPTDSPPPGQYKWRSKDAIAAYCVKCKMSFTYTPGTSKTVSRHLVAHHGLPDPSSKAKRRLLKPPPPRTIAKDVPDEESFDEESLRPRKKSKAASRRVLPSKDSPRSAKSTTAETTTIDTSFSSRDTAKTLPAQHQGGNNPRAEKIAKDLFHWMIASHQTPSPHPGNIVYSNTDRAGPLSAPSLFVDFCRNLDHSFEMPALEVMESLANTAHEKLSNEIKLRTSELFPLNSASDTDSNSNQEFISVSVRRVKVIRTTGYGETANKSTGHGDNKEGDESRTKRATNRQETFYPVRITFCTPTFRLKSYVAAVIPGDDDDENEERFAPYFRAVERTLSMYGLPEENVTRVVIRGEISNADSRDDGIEERADLSEIPKKESICLLERLDRTVMNTLDFLIGNSTSFQEILDAIEGEQGTQPTKRLEDTQEAYNILTRASSLPSPSARESANQVQKIIKPFHDAIQTLSVDSHPTIGLAIPIIRRVRDLLVGQQKRKGKEIEEDDVTTSGEDEDNVSHVAPIFRRAILKDFTNKFSLFLQENPPLMWTMLLDPRLIVMRGLSRDEQNHAKSMLIEEVTQLVHIIDQNEGEQKLRAVDRSQKDGNSDSSSPMNTMGGIFWGEELDQADSTSRSRSYANFVRNADDYAKKNVESYFNTVQSQRHIKNPLLWWKNNQNQFPELAILARKWICSSVIYGRPNTRANESIEAIPVNESDTEKIRRSIFLHDNIDLVYRKGFPN